MAMKSVAYTKAELKERNSPKKMADCMPYDSNKYPWGLRMDLNGDVMDKLGIDSLPKTGSVVTVHAKAKVVSTSVNDRDGKKEKRMELQIVAMEIEETERKSDSETDEAVDEIFKDMPDA